MTNVSQEPIQYAQTSNGIVIIRVFGKGTHLQSPGLRHIFDKTRKLEPPARYIVDLEHCTSMDSTFLGTLASIALHQRGATGTQTVLANVQDHVRYLLETLGLKFIVDIRGIDRAETALPTAAFKPAPSEIAPIDRIVMMIEAHEQLVDIDSQNEIKFEGVLKTLRESLDRARQDTP